ncbi:uncharacterized protein LOC124264908 [Haliotis rubra]|uniref:uncharacterized protein LOC124264908 n=1 Tax=Haliotis rubra TaxID=36100 RepID=UPI001EE5F62A|nr:uncharacterized protein LOC124264908 [Haliotis rubra]
MKAAWPAELKDGLIKIFLVGFCAFPWSKSHLQYDWLNCWKKADWPAELKDGLTKIFLVGFCALPWSKSHLQYDWLNCWKKADWTAELKDGLIKIFLVGFCAFPWSKSHLQYGCNDSDLPPNVGGDFMGPPQTLEVEGALYRNETLGISYSQVVITWTPPATASGFKNLKGFYVKIQRVIAGYPMPVCRVFDFSQNIFSSEDYKLTFRKKMLGFEGGINHLYHLMLYTLPIASASKWQSQFFKLQSPDVNSPGWWTAAVSYTNIYPSVPAAITARFSLAPKEFNFTNYIFTLMGERDTFNFLERCEISIFQASTCQGKTYDKPAANATSITITFTVTVVDVYRIRMEPDDPYWNDPNRCLCYEKTSSIVRSCVRCILTVTGDIAVRGGSQDESSTTMPRTTEPGASPTAPTGTTGTTTGTQDSHSVSPSTAAADFLTSEDVITVVAALAGGLVGIVCVSLVVVLLWRKHRSAGNNFEVNTKPGQNYLNQQNHSHAHPVKKVYLLYAEDHKDHINVITNLAIYLKDHCKCEVFFLPWFRGTIQTTGVYQWIMTHIDQSDYVILISSEAAYNLFDTRSTSTTYRADDEGPEGDTFSPAMTHVMAKSAEPGFFKKTILVYFEYTNEDFVLKEISPGLQYKLPKHFKELMCHIHEVNAMNRRQIEGMDNLQATTGGRNVLEAVTKAKHFETSDPDWFCKRFQRQDSAYGSQHEDEVEDSVSWKQRPVYANEGYDHDDEVKSAVTYNTAYATAHLEDMAAPSEVPTDTSTNFINMQLQRINMDNGGVSSTSPWLQYESYGFTPPSESTTRTDIAVDVDSIGDEDVDVYFRLDSSLDMKITGRDV